MRKKSNKNKEWLLTEEPLNISSRDWESIFNTIPDMITIQDRDFNIIKANKVAKKILDLPDEEITKTKCFKFYHGTDSPQKKCPSCKCLKTGETATFEVFEPHLNKFLEIRAIPRYNIDNELIGLIHVVRDITKRKKMEKKLKTLSVSDELTGLLNRRGFLTFVEQQCKLSDRNRKMMYMLYIDLNGMKIINDEFGHNAGDQALRDTANILKKTFRKTDIIARIGGDEFAVLLLNHSEPDIEHIIVEHIHDNLRIHNEQIGRSYKLLLSVGIKCYDPEHPCPPGELLNQADELMYEDKKKQSRENCEVSLLKRKEKREYKRFRIGRNSRVEFGSTGKVEVKDISPGGICLKTSSKLTVHDIHSIRIVYPDNADIVQTGIVVRSHLVRGNTDKDNGTHHYESGLKFVEINDRVKRYIDEVVNNAVN